MSDTVLAWHFVGDTLRDGRPVPPDGETLVHEGKLKPCISGLHASLRLIDAMKYSPGSTICRVECGGEIINDEDKLVCSERTIIWRAEGDAILRRFARECALSVAANWDCPDVVMRWLVEGDSTLRSAAESAAESAAWSAARSAAWSAAESAARSAARSAAESAAESAALSAARRAAESAAESAAWRAAWSAARSAARSASWRAAESVAWSEAWSQYDEMLTRLVMAERED